MEREMDGRMDEGRNGRREGGMEELIRTKHLVGPQNNC